MNVWNLAFQVYKPISSLPYPERVEVQIEDSPSYYCEGNLRKGKRLLFVYTLEGRGIFRLGNKEYDLTRETGFLCPIGDPSISWYYPKDTTIKWKFLWINFSGNVAREILSDLNKRYGYIYKIPISHILIKKLLNYENYTQCIYPLSPSSGAKVVFQILTSLGELFDANSVDNSQSLLVKQSQELILKKLKSNISVSSISNIFNISREHFSRIFKEQTGESPLDYIFRQKLLLACQMLKETSLSCKEIANSIGYSNSTNFSRAFKATLSITPKEFRTRGSMPLL